ncbi:exopolysaccharide biosynthesis protein [Phenylobacterium aquaticum]|uniref:exopolysaccharide biosynthesis protein n=1 Tax=Phenylobacterium aquaticum TaxID=1763816 RepID=UPI001F5C4264|nr:exopolysaccharide biosynthesis protein [Phenylobacterium aquaticum]MCI3134113.1 exopolysaccharide biosynthesis protein [Phenylobacterium aquaticum]
MSEHLKSSSVSQLLELIGAREAADVSVADILETFGNRAFGAMMFVFAAPLVLPMPPGVSAILGAPLMFITFQWMLGRRTLWLPKALLERTMSMSDFRNLMGKLTPYLERLERRLRPRLTFMYNPLGDRIVGALCFALSIIVFLPIPFGNMLPSFAIAAFAIGGAERDGVAALIGWIAAILSFFVLAVLSKAIIAAVMAFFATLIGMF